MQLIVLKIELYPFPRVRMVLSILGLQVKNCRDVGALWVDSTGVGARSVMGKPNPIIIAFANVKLEFLFLYLYLNLHIYIIIFKKYVVQSSQMNFIYKLFIV